MPDKFILSIDIGTSAVKAVVFDVDMNQISLARQSYPLIIPQSRWNEQDPDVILRKTQQAIAEVLQMQDPKNVMGVVLSCQMVSVMGVDAHGKPISRILTWGDTRGSLIAESFKRDPRASQIYKITGCPLEGIYPLSKIRWMIDNGLTQSNTRFISVKDYILFHLTGQFITDWSMASCTGLMDIRQHKWNPDALELVGITEGNLSELVSTKHLIKLKDSTFLQKTGIPVGTPLIMGAGDAPLSSLGVGALDPGTLVVNVGTSTAARKMISAPIPDEKQQLWTYVLDDSHWVTGGMSSSGGMMYDWYKNQFFPGRSKKNLAEMELLAAATPPGADGLIFIPYLAGEQCPSWQASTRGAFQGLDVLHTSGHLTRAILEGITFSIFRIIETIRSVHTSPIKEVRVTGGLATSPLWQQIAADIFGLPLVLANSVEGSARGGAFLALNALGYIESLDEVANHSITDSIRTPDIVIHERYMHSYGKFMAYLDCQRMIDSV